MGGEWRSQLSLWTTAAAFALIFVCASGGWSPKIRGIRKTGGGWSLGESGCGIQVTTPDAPKHAGILAEPFRSTRFVISHSCSSGQDEDHVFRSKAPNGQVAFGSEVFFNFTSKKASTLLVYSCPAEFADVNVGLADNVEWCKAKLGPQVIEVQVAVTYVRREIRSLSAIEREQYFHALWVMANTSTDEGQKIYGPKFQNYYEFAAKHWAGVLSVPCDLGHWGPALVTYHRVFIKEFENAIQSIYPHLALPYWDYFIDGALEDSSKSILWTNEYFGSSHGDENDDWIVKDGRFAYWKVPQGEDAEYWAKRTWGSETPTLGPIGKSGINPYGFMRSPNNMNKGRYLTRIGVFGDNKYPLSTYANWTMCRDMPQFGLYARCLDASSVHPSLHMGVGGNRGLPLWEEMKSKLDCGNLTQQECLTSLKFAQELSGPTRWTGFFEGCIRCDKKCASWRQDPSECACECLADKGPRCDPGEIFRRTMAKLFIDPAKLAFLTGTYMLEKIKEFAHYTVCAEGNGQGDYYDLAASALDPIFWSHHAMLDRLSIGYKLTYDSKPWSDMDFTFPSPDMTVYPDFLSTTNILEPFLGNLSKSFYAGVFPPGDSNPSGICIGHGYFDTISRGIFINVFESLPTNKPHTNEDITKSMDIEAKEIANADYIYDHYQM